MLRERDFNFELRQLEFELNDYFKYNQRLRVNIYEIMKIISKYLKELEEKKKEFYFRELVEENKKLREENIELKRKNDELMKRNSELMEDLSGSKRMEDKY